MIIINELRKLIRDRVSLILMLVFPLVLIYLLGVLIQSTDNAEQTIGDINIQYSLEKLEDHNKKVATLFIKNTQIDGVTFDENTNIDKALQNVKDEKIDAFIYFKNDMIEVHEGKDHIKNRTVSALIEGYITSNNASMAMVKITPESVLNSSTVKNSYIDSGNAVITRTMMDYYGVTMLVLTVLFGALAAGSGAFNEERKDRTLNRLSVSPLKKETIFIQKIIGLIPSSILQIIVIMTVATTVFGVKYATTLVGNLLLIVYFLLTAITVLIFSVMVSLLVKWHPFLPLMSVLWVTMFLGGTFSKEIYIHGLSNHMPSFLLQKATFQLTLFNNPKPIYLIMLVEIILLIVCFGVSSFKFKRFEEVR